MHYKAVGRLVVAACLVISLSSCKFVKMEEDADSKSGPKEVEIYFSDKKFNPVKIVNELWSPKVVPYVAEKAAFFPELKSAIDADLETAGVRYGRRGNSESSPWTFITKGEAKVLSVDLSSKAATAQLDVMPEDGKPDLVLQLGPVIRGSSLRDSLAFISFDSFANQIEFARISTAFNNRIKKDVLKDLDREDLSGKRIQFLGTFSIKKPSDPILVTPVNLTKIGGSQ